MARIKVKVDRGNGLTQVVTIDTSATQGARLGADLYLPNGQVATPSSFLTWLGVTPSSGGGSSSGPSLQSILTTKGDLATRDSNVQRLGIGGQDDALRVSAGGLPEWRAGAILSKVDDTNVTLTLTGTPLKALMAAAGLTLGWTGQLAATRGGTGFGSYAAGDTLYANSTTTLAKLAIGAAGTVYRVSGGAPAWQAPAALTKTDDTNVTLTLGGAPATALLAAASLTLGWTGTLAATRGGTGFGSYAVGDILYASSTSALSKLAATTNGFVLTLAAGVPVWAAASGGATGANPTASVGLTAVNGVATTYLRSDGAPALDQGIAPTWTSEHRFTGSLAHSVASSFVALGLDGAGIAEVRWISSTAAANAKRWDAYADSSWTLRAVDDAPSVVRNALEFQRSGVAISVMNYGNATDQPRHTFFGALLASGQITGAPSFGQSGLFSAVFVSGGDHYPQFTWYSSPAGSDEKIWDALIIPTDKSFTFRAANDAYNAAVDWLKVIRSGMSIASITFPTLHNGSAGNLRSGTYTPTLAGITNVNSTTAHVCQWMRVGNVVTVSGYATVAPTSPGVVTEVSVTLPVASTWSTGAECMGTCCDNDEPQVPGSVVTSGTTKAALRFKCITGVAAHAIVFHFTYLVQ